MERDSERSRTYAAEDAAFAGTFLVERPGFGTLARLIGEVTCSPFWRRSLRLDGAPEVRMKQVGVAGGSWSDRQRLIRLSHDSSWLVAVHELAHCVHSWVGVDAHRDAPHGSRFRGFEVLCLEAVFGGEPASLLADRFAGFGLAVDVPDVVLPVSPVVVLPGLVPAVRRGWAPSTPQPRRL